MSSGCSKCEREAVVELGHGRELWASVCVIHADELMASLRKEVPQAEGDAGWEKWLRDSAQWRTIREKA